MLVVMAIIMLINYYDNDTNDKQINHDYHDNHNGDKKNDKITTAILIVVVSNNKGRR